MSEFGEYALPPSARNSLTKDEMTQYTKEFKAFDTDKDGQITSQELKEALARVGQKPTSSELSAAMKEADVDKNGTVSFMEFVSVMIKLKADPNSANLFTPKINKAAGSDAGGMAYHSYSDDEKTAFTEHINNCLARDVHVGHRLPMDIEGEALFKDTSDGIILCKLINLAEFDTIDIRALNLPSERKPNLSIFQMIENMNLALNAAKGIGCVVTNVNAKDIIDGNPILILGLVWQIIRIQLLSSISLTSCPELVILLQEEEELDDLLALQPEAILLRWFNHHLERANHPKRVKNFGKDLADSDALSVLLNQLDPGHCDLIDESDPTERARHVIMNAQEMGVETFIKPSDIVSGNKKLNLAFVAQLFNTNPNLQVDEATLENFKADFAALDLDDAGDTREEKVVFRMWINSLAIDGGNLYINSLFNDVQDGAAILKVMDKIQPGVIKWKRVNENPKNRYKKVENGNYVIETGKVMGLTLVNVGGLDIIDGNKKMILAVMWQLMRAHTLNLLNELSAGRRRIEDADIVKWANSKSSGMRIRNFQDKVISNAVFLLKVCHGINRGVVNWDLVAKDADTLEAKINNAKYAISVARKLGALVFLCPEDIVEVRSKMIMLYCASLWHAENNIKEQQKIEAEQALEAAAARTAAAEQEEAAQAKAAEEAAAAAAAAPPAPPTVTEEDQAAAMPAEAETAPEAAEEAAPAPAPAEEGEAAPTADEVAAAEALAAEAESAAAEAEAAGNAAEAAANAALAGVEGLDISSEMKPPADLATDVSSIGGPEVPTAEVLTMIYPRMHVLYAPALMH
ncbi:unnamed protein product [Chrysoparadoxa australica]